MAVNFGAEFIGQPRKGSVAFQRDLDGEILAECDLDLAAVAADVEAHDALVEAAIVLDAIGSGKVGEYRAVAIDPDRPVIEAAAGHRRSYGRSEEHTSEYPSLMRISYAVFCLKPKKY